MLKVRKSSFKQANASFLAILLLSGGINCGAAYAQHEGGGQTAPSTPPADWKSEKVVPPALVPALIQDWQKAEPPQALTAPKILPGEQTTLDPQGHEIKLPKSAEEAIRQIPTLMDIPQTPQSIDKVNRLDAEGEKQFGNRATDKALEKWQEEYALSMEMRYPEGQGRALTNMSRCFLVRGQAVKAKYLAENAVEILGTCSDKTQLGKARVALAQAYFALDNSLWACQQLDEALKIFTNSTGNNSKDAAEVLDMAGALLLRVNKVKEAIQFYEAAATYFVKANDVPDAVRNHTAVAELMEELGWYQAALEEAHKAVNCAQSESANPTIVVPALAALGTCYYGFGEYQEAKKTFEETLTLAAKLTPQQIDALSMANLYLGYGCSLNACGDYDNAKKYLTKCLPTFKTGGIKSILGQATALNVLANINAAQGQNAAAIANLLEALELQQAITPRQDRLHVILLQNLAVVQYRNANLSDAKMRLQLATNLFGGKSYKDPLLQGRTYTALAEVFWKLADAQQAETALQSGLAISEKLDDDAALWRDYTLLAKIQTARGEKDLAKESIASALSHFRSPQAGSFPSPERMEYPTSREDLGQELVALVASQGMPEQALLAAEQLKEEAFVNEWLRKGESIKSDDKAIYSELSVQRAHYHAAEGSATPNRIVGQWKSWLERFRLLIQQNRALARLIAPVPTPVSDIVKSAQISHATILDYLVGEKTSVLFTVDPKGRLTATILPVGRKQLQSQVAAVVGGSTQQTPDSERNTLSALYNELLPPGVKAYLPSNPEQMIVIVPDGILFNLPFAALIDPSGKYFVESHTLTLASSAGALVDSPPKYTEDLSLVVATPGATPDGDNPVGNEISAISGLFQPEQVVRLGGKDADDTWQDQIRGKAVVHFISSSQLRAGQAAKKPSADRLIGMNIPSDLVVLSGTSVTKEDQGNAVKVYSRGLNYAGARNVLMSLWQAPQAQRTSELVDFYKGKQSGLNQAQSLRKAQLLSLSRDPSPRSWAAFQLLGPGY